jgi:hypothetical protein
VDEDLETMTREQVIAEARRLRAGIRAHRDSTGHALCWHHPALWGLLPERTDPLPTVPTWPEFLRGCLRYRQSLDEQLPVRWRPIRGIGAGCISEIPRCSSSRVTSSPSRAWRSRSPFSTNPSLGAWPGAGRFRLM